MLVSATSTASNATVWDSKIRIAASTGVRPGPAPINPADVLKGNPVASGAGLFRSVDRMESAVLWHCTAGTFRWRYGEDETVLIVDGGMTLQFDDGTSRSCGQGDVVYFPAGSSCVWVVEREVRKIALLRDPLPAPISLGMRCKRRAVNALRRNKLLRTLFGRRPPRLIAGAVPSIGRQAVAQ